MLKNKALDSSREHQKPWEFPASRAIKRAFELHARDVRVGT